jgi:hypothetical protein
MHEGDTTSKLKTRALIVICTWIVMTGVGFELRHRVRPGPTVSQSVPTGRVVLDEWAVVAAASVGWSFRSLGNDGSGEVQPGEERV